MTDERWAAAEFFAGIGLARLGLERAGFRVVWANDMDLAKHAMYAAQFPSDDGQFVLGDVSEVHGADQPAGLALAWASFPCKDLSLAGGQGGIYHGQSGAFWGFTQVMRDMGGLNRPPVVVLENVPGLIFSRSGQDLRAVVEEMNAMGYVVDAVVLDARWFLPQSRPRLFLVCTLPGLVEAPDAEPNPGLRPDALQWLFQDPDLTTCRRVLPPVPEVSRSGLSSVLEDLAPGDPEWWHEGKVHEFLAQLNALHAERVASVTTLTYRTAYRRTRGGVPMWEVRSDDIAGCLRTPGGGSSKQAVIRMAPGESPRVRWMTPLEYARLMGAGDYPLDGFRPNQVRYGFGDAVCVPVVEWLAEHYLRPVLECGVALSDRAA